MVGNSLVQKSCIVVITTLVLALVLSACTFAQDSTNSSDTTGTPEGSNPPSLQSSDESDGQSPSLDWSKASDRALVNERLRWVAQAFCNSETGSVELNAENFATFAVSYIAVNENSAIESGDYSKTSSVGGGARGVTNMRVSEGLASKVVREFFDAEPDFSQLNGQGRYGYVDGYIYFGTTGSLSQLSAYAAADELKDLGGGRYSAPFLVISSMVPYAIPSNDFYAQSADDMLAKVPNASETRSGEAVLRVIDGKGERKVVIESLRLAKVGNAAATDNASKSSGAASAESIACDAFKVDLPSSVSASLEASWPQKYHLVVKRGDVRLFEIRCPNLAAQSRGSEGKLKSYKLGSAVAEGRSDEAIMNFFYVDPSGNGNAHWNNKDATDLGVQKLLGMAPEEAISRVSLRNADGEWVPVTDPIFVGGD